MPKFLALSGSLRAQSFNTMVLEEIAQLAEGKADVTIHPLADIPMYNGDLDTPEGVPAVDALKAAIADADALILATPEYNYSVSGALKNAIDWVSRPAFQSVLKDKPVAIVSASMAFTGGVRAQQHLKSILSGTLSLVVPMPEVVIGSVHTQFDENGKLNNDMTRKHLAGLVDATLAFIS